MTAGIAVALLLQRLSTALRILVQCALLVAWAMPVIAVLTVFEWMFDAQYGVVNWVLERLGTDYAGHSWLLQPLSFYVVASLVVVWMSVPFVAFTSYAALTGVPADIVEASEIDGAGPVQRLVYVVLPSIKPVLLVVGLLQVIWDMRVFTQVYVLQQAGGITHDTNLLGTYIYRIGIGESRFGMAAAIAMFMLALTALLTAPYIRSMLRTEKEA
jgi:N,N'-diacetylchitobiose transport system permease protein